MPYSVSFILPRSILWLCTASFIATSSLMIHRSAAAQQPLVGVLRPALVSGGGIAAPALPDISKMTAHLSKKQREQVEAAYASANAGAATDTVHQQMAVALTRVVQTNWVAVLQRNGIEAVAIDADTPAAVSSDALQKGVKWLLGTTVSHHVASSNVSLGNGARVSAMSLEVSVHYTLVDTSGSVLIPGLDTTHASTSNPGQSSEPGDTSVWLLDGNDISQAVASALPRGTVHPHDPQGLLPKPPLMANSVRFDFAVVDSRPDSGVRVFGHDVMPGTSDISKVIFEYANGSLVTQQKGQGILYTPGSDNLLIVDDTTRHYFSLTPADLDTMRGISSTFSQGAMHPKLIATDPGAVTTRHYRFATQDNSVPIGQLPGATTTVDIGFAGPTKLWKDAVSTLKSVGGGLGAGLIRLNQSPEVSEAIWEVLFESPNPPAHIAVRTVYGGTNSKYPGMDSGSDISIQQGVIPKAMDFTIPPDYTWTPSPMLWSIAMY